MGDYDSAGTYGRGNVHACELLYKRHYPAVVRYAAGRVDPMIAEDIAQEAFMHYASAATTTSVAMPEAYLWRIVVNLCINWGTRKRLALLPLEEQYTTESRDDPEQRYLNSESQDELLGCLDRLGERQRAALVMWGVEKRSYKDIGTTMGVSDRAAEGLVARARERFRQTSIPREGR